MFEPLLPSLFSDLKVQSVALQWEGLGVGSLPKQCPQRFFHLSYRHQLDVELLTVQPAEIVFRDDDMLES